MSRACIVGHFDQQLGYRCPAKCLTDQINAGDGWKKRSHLEAGENSWLLLPRGGHVQQRPFLDEPRHKTKKGRNVYVRLNMPDHGETSEFNDVGT